MKERIKEEPIPKKTNNSTSFPTFIISLLILIICILLGIIYIQHDSLKKNQLKESLENNNRIQKAKKNLK